jgi:cytochrome b561
MIDAATKAPATPERAGPTRYNSIAQIFHWVTAALIITQFVLARMAKDLPLGGRKLELLARHKSVGMTVFMLAVLRLAWRLFKKAPPLPANMPKLERLGAHLSHWALYALIFLMPVTGWLMSSAKNYSVSWFHLFTWPNLIAPNERAFEVLKTVHDSLATVLFVVAIVHMLAALKHHFWHKDDVLKRMLPSFKSDKSSSKFE